jgi:tRNA pseudouridine38-40 synthase
MGQTRWRIDVEYDGRDFAGWQFQPGQRTVQGSLTAAAGQFLGQPVRIDGAGRTDSGVHACQQVAAFTTDVDRPQYKVASGLNAHLGLDVAVLSAQQVPLSFDPRRAPHTKCYRYRWLDRPERSALRGGRVWHVQRRLNAEAMMQAVLVLRGDHDFTSFRAAGCSAKTAVRTVLNVCVQRDGDEVHLEMQGKGFLRHMVRIVAGSLYEIGRGSRPPGWLSELLQANQRSAAGQTAPAHGLCLMWTRYL